VGSRRIPQGRKYVAMRIHILLPDDLMSELDELVGPRGRSRFVAEALRERLLGIVNVNRPSRTSIIQPMQM
jgi:metal-responsive CopG/Arc/MetJ family transcriptional regulator